MTNNTLVKLCVKTKPDCKYDDVLKLLNKEYLVIEKCYSYLIQNEYDEDETLIGYQVEVMISSIDRFNTIEMTNACIEIVKIVTEKQTEVRRMSGFKQPPIGVLIEAFTPLVTSLVITQSKKWADYEYDDLMQMCYECIIRLKRKNYYIHKGLINKAFMNDVLLGIRKKRFVDKIDSLDMEVTDGENFTPMVELIEDSESLENMYNTVEISTKNRIMEAQKVLLIDLLGKRTYDQLIREYGNKYTTPWSRRKVWSLKKTLTDMGIDRKSFDYLKDV